MRMKHNHFGLSLASTRILLSAVLTGCGGTAEDAAITAPDGETTTADPTAALDDRADEAIASSGTLNLGSMYRGQQAYFLENQAFAANLADLDLGIAPEDQNFSYAITSTDAEKVVMTAVAKNEELKSAIAAVFITPTNEVGVAIVCETETPSTTPPDEPVLNGETPECAAGSTPVE